MTSLIAAIALVFAGVALLALNAKKRCQSVPSVFATAFRSFARIGQGEANARLVFLVATVIGLASFQSAHAQSSGCAAINSAWGGGRSFTGGSEFYQDGLTILAGEQLTYTVTTSGTGNPNSAGFAIYQNDGTAPGDILLEQYASPGAELSLSNTITLPEDDDRFIVYAWSDVGGGTVQATVTCSGKTDQTITFTNPGAQTFGTTPTLTASASSGLTPVLTSATTGVCTIDSAKVLTFVTTGTCTINANQAGNSSYNAAPQVQQSFTVNPAPPIAGAVSLTVAAYSSANPVTLNLSGGTATSVAIAEAASHGTAVASGTSITYTPTSGYSGSDSFTYTAENSGGTSSPATVSVTVSAPPQLSINDVSQLEDDSGTTTFTFTVSLDKPAGTSGVSFDIATANGTASASSDYDAKSLTSQTIPAGSSSAVFSVTVNGDTTFEADETFFVNVTNVLNATNADSQGLGSILNDDLATPTVLVSTSDSNPTRGTSVSFTATMAGGSSPTGTVTFKDGSTTLGTGTISGTAATFSTAALAVGSHSITAVYGGDTSNAGATSSAITVAVAQVSPTLTVSAADSSPALGASVTFTATLAGGSSPTGTVTFKDGSATLGTGTISGTTATFSTAALAVGTHTIAAVYGGDTDNTDATSSSITVTVGQLSPTVTVSASDSSPALGASVTFTATLSGGLSPTGTVTFKNGATTLGTGTISGTTATFSTAALAVGAHSVIAVYDGDTNNAAATSSATTVTVAQRSPTVTVSASDTTPALGVSVTFTATLSGGSSPTGTVTFKNGATTLGTGTISGTTATFSTAALAVGAHSVIAVYGGDTNNAIATSSAITVTVGQLSPTLTISVSDTSPALGASVTFTATLEGGSSPTGTVTFKEGSTTLSTGKVSSGNVMFSTTSLKVGVHSIRAEYAGDVNNAAAASAALRIKVGKLAPTVTVIASDSSPAFGASVTFTATLSGGSSPAGVVTFKDGSTTLGTGTVSSGKATFSTTAFGVGTHSITAAYAGDMNNAAATSAAVSIKVGKLSPTVAVSASNTNPALGASVRFTATLAGGSSPTGIITFKNGSTTLGTGSVSGTTATFSTATLKVGAHSIRAEYAGDTNHAAAASAAITVTVKASVMVFTPTGGALAEAMVGEAYSQRISAKGGVGALTYRLKTGALPAGVVLNISTGELTGPLSTAAKAKSYSFVIEAKDGFSTTGTASYTLPVKPRAVTVTDKTIDVPPGSAPVNVNLEAGATGGPFVSADPTFVEPATAGTASIVRGEFAAAGSTSLGWYLKFIPNPAFSGTAKVGFKLTSVLGVSNTGTVSYKISYDAAKVSEDIDALVHGFIRTRQGLIASAIKVPGLLERRQLEDAIDPVTARMTPSEDGMTASFSTSLAQMEAARNSADGVAGGSALPLNVWLDGVLMAHKRDENDGKWGSFAMLNVGADYLISEKALIGLSFHLDRMTDPSNVDAELSGNGWLAGPYASFEIGKGVFWDTSLRYGGSSNDIDTAFWDGSFDTQRWMIDTAIRGEWQIGEATVLTPKLRAIYFNETVDDYTVRNDGGDELDIDGFDAEQFRVSLGAEIARSFTLESGAKVTPKLGVTAGYAGIDGPGIYGSLTAGVTMQTPDFWMLEASLLLNIENDGQKSVGATVRAGKQF